MTIKTSAIVAALKEAGVPLELRGPDVAVRGPAAVESCGPGDLVFVDAPERATLALERRPAAAVTKPELAEKLGALTALVTPNVRLAQARITSRFFDRPLRDEGWPVRHPSAVVHETAVIPATAAIGPNAVIGARTRLGERCVVLAGAVLEHDVVVGDDSVIHPNAVIGYGTRIGRRAIVKAGSIVASEGFGFAQDDRKKNRRIPHLGIVVLEDDVVVGSNCCIDRATFGETRIGAGTVLDNLCHVAHNVKTGEDCILTAMLCVAGSATLGNRVVTSGMTGILDHVAVCDDVALVHRAGVANDIKEPGVYAGWPLQPLKEYLKSTAILHRLAELRATIRELEDGVASLKASRS